MNVPLFNNVIFLVLIHSRLVFQRCKSIKRCPICKYIYHSWYDVPLIIYFGQKNNYRRCIKKGFMKFWEREFGMTLYHSFWIEMLNHGTFMETFPTDALNITKTGNLRSLGKLFRCLTVIYIYGGFSCRASALI